MNRHPAGQLPFVAKLIATQQLSSKKTEFSAHPIGHLISKDAT